jgi:glycosyltransferase involved in cell wall biosynthesis
MRAQFVYLLSEDPLILTGSFGSFDEMSKVRKPFTYIYHNPGFIRGFSLPRYIKLARSFNRNSRIKFVTNERSESIWLRSIGLDASHITQSLHARENFFVPGNLPKLNDAVYAATLAPFKRIELARAIESIHFVTYVTHQKSWDLHSFEPRLSHATFNREFVSKEEVLLQYQKARVGLALSKSEGAMWASVEYLLCGLPVVTTFNRGGRDRYFSEKYVTWCPPDPSRIKDAVRQFVEDPPSPEFIRNQTISRMTEDRYTYLSMLAEEFDMHITSTDDEVERIWGGIEGIEKHAVAVADLKKLL